MFNNIDSQCYLKIQDDEDDCVAELGFDPLDKQLFMHALKEGNESDNFIRVMVVGNFNQGKTSLTRRLLQLPMENIESTDGIDIHAANCEDNVTWKTTGSNVAEIKGARRLANIIIQSIKSIDNTETLDDGNEQEDDIMLQVECNDDDDDDKNAESFEDGDTCDSLDEIENQGNCLAAVTDKYFSKTSFSKTSSNDNSKIEKCFTSGLDVSEEKAIINEPVLQIKAVDLLSEFTEKLKDENYASNQNGNGINVNIWDFGGQFIYYATHQIFHSRDAIYLLVFDLTKDLNSIVEDEDFPDKKFDMRTCLKFWIMSVHAFVGTKDGKEPTIILVGTHKADCISKSDIEKKFDDVYDLFIKSKARNHIYKIPFAVENTDPNDPGITELKTALFEIGSEKAKGSKVPAKWIQLEEALKGNKENRKILKYEDVQNIDKSTDLPINDEEQLQLFLKYHHAKGTIVYFDEEKLREFVVIDPQLLVDAFKCIITSKRFCKWKSDIHELWEKLMETAVLDKYLLNTIWEHDDKNRFIEHKDILLAFLQRHRILAEMQVIDEVTSDARGTGKYIVPSLLKSEGDQSILKRCSALAEWFQDGTIINNEKGLQKKVTEKYLTKVAQTIGQNWELLGPMLGISKVDVERIKMDHNHCTETAIFYMLHKWNMQCPNQNTMGDLINTMKECEAISVDWDKVNNILDGFLIQ
ncbi:probable serine/threonine-protein kinase roco6 [Ruditapes philippinarum]|uniref:probable serine/threonine-protein kinase roco6 n=1 Tax=Ruditapes philippinarum TaxID=129788 RepID=UPI00295B0388|nr:probable serine/threonine-protein kinase roco6 [Ruditapes philippinarum]